MINTDSSLHDFNTKEEIDDSMSSPSSPQCTSVSPDQATTFPLETLTRFQQKAFVDYLEARRDTGMNLYDPIWLTLLLVKKRPGILLTTLRPPLPVNPPEPLITKEEVAAVFDLAYCESDDNAIYISRTGWLLDIIPAAEDDKPSYHRRLGCFLGYPRKDIESFIHSNHISPIDEGREKYGEFEPEELAYAAFVPYLHADSLEGLERAIRIGENNYQTVLMYADQWNLPQLEKYTEHLFQREVADCTGFSFNSLS